MEHCGYQTSTWMSDALWAVWTKGKDLYSRTWWSKLQTFSFISKKRDIFGAQYVQEYTYRHTCAAWKTLILLMKSSDDNTEQCWLWSWYYMNVWERDLWLDHWIMVWGSLLIFPPVFAQTTTVCVRMQFWWLLLGAAVMFRVSESIQSECPTETKIWAHQGNLWAAATVSGVLWTWDG